MHWPFSSPDPPEWQLRICDLALRGLHLTQHYCGQKDVSKRHMVATCRFRRHRLAENRQFP